MPTIVLAGKEYGSGSSRDWAAGTMLGVEAVVAELTHSSLNLVRMGILPLQFVAGQSAAWADRLRNVRDRRRGQGLQTAQERHGARDSGGQTIEFQAGSRRHSY